MAKRFPKRPEGEKKTASLISAVTEGGSKRVGRPKQTEEPLSKFNCTVPESLYEAFREAVEGRGQTMTWLVRDFMQRYVEENKKQ